MRHPIETLWREVGLPEYFLGDDGSNAKLYALYDAILARSSERTDAGLDAFDDLGKLEQALAQRDEAIRQRDEEHQKNIDWAKGNLQRVREDVRADVLLAEAIAAERERCARIAEHDDRQMEWPRLEQDGRRMAPTARMQQAIATAIRRALVSSPVTEKTDG